MLPGTSNTLKAEISNKKGLKLKILMNLASLDSKAPCVLVLHGFTGFKEEEHLAAFAEGLAASGFHALRFDCSGFGESDGSPESDFRVSNYLSDIQHVMDHLTTLPFVDQNRLGICGHSLGGGLAIITAAKDNRIKACCGVQASKINMLGSQIYDLEKWQSTGWFEKETEHPTRGKIRLPWSFAVDRNQHDASEAVTKLKIPLMLMYGTKDQAVPQDMVLSMYESATCNKQLVKLDGFEHDFKKRPEQVRLATQHLVEFFKLNL